MIRKSLRAQLIGAEQEKIRADTMTDDATESVGTQDVGKYQKYAYLRPQIKSQADSDSVKFGTTGYASSVKRGGLHGLAPQ